MAKSSKRELDEIKSLLLEIDRIYQKIGISNPFSKDKAAQFVGQINSLKDALEDANDILHDMDGGIGDITKSWKAIIDEAKAYKNSIYSSKNALTSLSSISEKLMNHQKGISNLSSKQLKSLQEQAKANRESLNTNQDLLQSQIDVLKNKEKRARLDKEEQKKLASLKILYENVNNLLEDKDSILFKTNQMLEDELELTSKIEQKTGILGGLLKGISRIPIFGNIFDAKQALEASEKAIRDTTKSTSGLKAAFQNISGQIKDGILNPSNLVLVYITALIKALSNVDSGAGDLAKSMNKTYSEALGIRKELTDIANSSGDAALNTKGLQETYMAIGKTLGTNAMINEADLKVFTKLREQAGYTNEELFGIQQLSLVNGKTLAQNTKQILGGAQAYAAQNKLVVNEKQVLTEISKASASLKLSLDGSADALAISVVKAKQFGLNLEQAEKISQNLLNFESSIESELSAELLLGKNLNFEKARLLALNGDIAASSAEIAKQVGTSADFANMNVIQQEAIAKAAGLTRDELAQSLMDREALAQISAKEGESAQEAFNRLVKEVGLEKAKKQLGDDALANQFAQQSIQERFNQTVLKLQEIFVNVANAVLPIVDAFSGVFDMVGWVASKIGQVISFTGEWGKTLLSVIVAYKTLKLLTGDIGKGTIAINVAKKLGLITDTQADFYAKQKVYFQNQSLGLNAQNQIYEKASLLTAVRKSVVAKATAFWENNILMSMIRQTVMGAKDLAISVAKASASVIGNAWTSLGPIPFVGAALAAAAAGAGIAYLLSQTKKGDDVMSPGGGYGKRTLFGPEGAIQLNDKDTVIAGTNLFDGKKQTGTQTQPTQVTNVSSVNMEQTNALLQQLINVISSGGDVVLDGQKVGSALKLGSFKTQ
jgi:hypothetical protein